MFAELEKYYTLQQKLSQRFLAQTWWPVFQFVAATFVIAALISSSASSPRAASKPPPTPWDWG